MDNEERTRERQEVKELIDHAVAFRDEADYGKSFLFIPNHYGGHNDYFMDFLSDLGYVVTEHNKYCKKVSWETQLESE